MRPATVSKWRTRFAKNRLTSLADALLDGLDPGPVTYVLLPPYGQELDRVSEMYPGGEEVLEYSKRGALRFAVYHLP